MNPDRYLVSLKRMNWPMAGATALIAVIGVMFVYSASFITADQPALRFQRQVTWMLIGAFCFVCTAAMDYRRLCRDSWWIYAVTIVLLVLVLTVGTTIRGGRRWLTLPGGLTIQPSEFVKIAVIMVLARFLSRPDLDLDKTWVVGAVLLIAGVPAVMILAQPDLGTALVFPPVAFVMMYVARVRGRILALLALVGIVMAMLAMAVLFLPEKLGYSEERQERIIEMAGLKQYHKTRIETFLNPRKDLLGAGWNKMQSEIAIGSGGLTGKGWLKGTANILGFLPRTVAPSDFIFAVVAEEKGFFGAVTVIFLFATIIVSSLLAAAAAIDKLGRMLCVGVAAMLFTHVFVNVGMTVGLFPITGIPLPLMSSGGSFAVGIMVSLGIVQSVYVRRRFVRY